MAKIGRPRVLRTPEELKEMKKKVNEKYYQSHRENWKVYNEVQDLTAYEKALTLFVNKVYTLEMNEEQMSILIKAISELKKIEI